MDLFTAGLSVNLLFLPRFLSDIFSSNLIWFALSVSSAITLFVSSCDTTSFDTFEEEITLSLCLMVVPVVSSLDTVSSALFWFVDKLINWFVSAEGLDFFVNLGGSVTILETFSENPDMDLFTAGLSVNLLFLPKFLSVSENLSLFLLLGSNFSFNLWSTLAVSDDFDAALSCCNESGLWILLENERTLCFSFISETLFFSSKFIFVFRFIGSLCNTPGVLSFSNLKLYFELNFSFSDIPTFISIFGISGSSIFSFWTPVLFFFDGSSIFKGSFWIFWSGVTRTVSCSLEMVSWTFAFVLVLPLVLGVGALLLTSILLLKSFWTECPRLLALGSNFDFILKSTFLFAWVLVFTFDSLSVLPFLGGRRALPLFGNLISWLLFSFLLILFCFVPSFCLPFLLWVTENDVLVTDVVMLLLECDGTGSWLFSDLLGRILGLLTTLWSLLAFASSDLFVPAFTGCVFFKLSLLPLFTFSSFRLEFPIDKVWVRCFKLGTSLPEVLSVSGCDFDSSDMWFVWPNVKPLLGDFLLWLNLSLTDSFFAWSSDLTFLILTGSWAFTLLCFATSDWFCDSSIFSPLNCLAVFFPLYMFKFFLFLLTPLPIADPVLIPIPSGFDFFSASAACCFQIKTGLTVVVDIVASDVVVATGVPFSVCNEKECLW